LGAHGGGEGRKHFVSPRAQLVVFVIIIIIIIRIRQLPFM